MPPILTAKPIALGADHRGHALKDHLKAWLLARGHPVHDCGAHGGGERIDAMDPALALVAELRHGRSDFAVGLCGTGQMIAITANRFPFIRATLLHTPEQAALARQHGDANLLALGADLIDAATAERVLEAFLTTAPLGGRYAARRERLAGLDPSRL